MKTGSLGFTLNQGLEKTELPSGATMGDDPLSVPASFAKLFLSKMSSRYASNA